MFPDIRRQICVREARFRARVSSRSLLSLSLPFVMKRELPFELNSISRSTDQSTGLSGWNGGLFVKSVRIGDRISRRPSLVLRTRLRFVAHRGRFDWIGHRQGIPAIKSFRCCFDEQSVLYQKKEIWMKIFLKNIYRNMYLILYMLHIRFK